jgi:hypothetical protein
MLRRPETMRIPPGYASLPACSSGERRIDRNQRPPASLRRRRVVIACNHARRASDVFSAHACTLEAMRTQGVSEEEHG